MSEHLLKYNHFWLTPTHALKGTLLAQHHFSPHPSDLFLASLPKSGTTWLRSLMFSIINRHTFHITNHPLLTTNPHDCFPFLEAHVCANYTTTHLGDDSMFPSDNNLYATHIPFSLLPVSVKDHCKTVYVARDPKDVFISKWHFMSELRPKQLPPLTLEDALELFCDGVSHYGPYWNHALEYWKASLEHPEKVMFMKYEDIMREPSVQVKRLAHFMGQPFTEAEESDGEIEGIIRLCSFEHLSKLDVNTITSNPRAANFGVENKHFFRKGVVGDGKNKLSPQMIHRLDQITDQKLLATGLCFQ
uniref:Sulfotransferase n=1 Tax=Kalanchoe fedtschenkoi TaxID=63787 RepID=A0A7N0U9R5_KALFE